MTFLAGQTKFYYILNIPGPKPGLPACRQAGRLNKLIMGGCYLLTLSQIFVFPVGARCIVPLLVHYDLFAIIRVLPTVPRMRLLCILCIDDEVHQFILKISREQFADQSESNRRFDRIMDELAEQRKKSGKRWKENQRKSDEQWEKHGKEHERMMLEISRLPANVYASFN